MVTLVFVRHGESKSNEMNVFTGQTDVALSALGQQQAALLKGFILQNYKIDAIYASDLKRAYDTVLPIAEVLQIPIQKDKGLREIDGGAWEEKSVADIAKLYPDDYRAWCQDIGLAKCTGGESIEQLQKRAVATVSRIASANEGKTILIGTHAGFLRAMQCFWQGLPLSEMKNVPWMPNASVSEIACERGRYTIVRLADISFLQGEVTKLAKGI